MSLKATKSGAVYTSDVISQGGGESDWVNVQTTLKCRPKEMTVLSGGSSTSLKTVDLVTTGEELVVYDGTAVKSGAVGAVTSVVGDNNVLGGELVFNTNSTFHLRTTTLINGNTVVAYSDGGNSNKGTFVIISDSGTVIKGETIFNDGTSTQLECISLANGNFVIVYSQSSVSSYGFFIIYDANGNIVKSATRYGPDTAISDVSGCRLSSGNFIISFKTANDSYGNFIIFSQDGSEIKAKTIFNPSNTATTCSIPLLDGGFIIAYSDAGTGTFQVFNSSGTATTNEIIFNSGVDYIRGILLPSGYFLLIFSDTGNGNQGSFMVYDTSGTVKKTKTYFNTNISSHMDVNINSTKILIAFRDENGYGQYVIYNFDYTIAKAKTLFNGSVEIQYCRVNRLNNENIAVSYSDGGNSYYGTFLRFATGTSYTSDITSLALSGTPTKVWKSSDLPETYTSFEGTGRTLLADYPVDMTSSTASQVVFKDNLNGLLKTGDELGVDATTVTTSNVVETAVVGDNLPGTPVTINTWATSYTDCVTLMNGNIFLVYADGTPGQGTFQIVNSSGGIVKGETVFDGSEVSYIRASLLKNGNVIISFLSSFDNYGSFVIYDESGSLVKSKTVFLSGPFALPSIVTLENSNFLISFTDNSSGGNGQGNYVIYDQTGVLVKSKSNFIAKSISGHMSKVLKNGNIIIAYRENVSTYYGGFVIIDSIGTLVKSETIFDSAATASICVTVLKSGNFVIAYENNMLATASFVIYDQSGTLVKSKTQYNNTRVPEYNQIQTLNNGNFLIAYLDNTNLYGNYVIYDASGNLVKAEASFYTASTIQYLSSSVLSYGNVVLHYAATNISKMSIINTAQYSTYTCTIPAQVSAPLTAKIPSRATLNVPYSYSYLSSNLNIVYNQIENTARDIQFKHIAKNKDDRLTSTSFALNKGI